MQRKRTHEQPLGDLIDADLPAEELERLARVDALLRAAAAHDRGGAVARPTSVRRCTKW